MSQEQQYLDLMRELQAQYKNSALRPDRTGVGTAAVFGKMMVFDLSQGEFPQITTKQVNAHGFMAEMDWFLSGSCDAHDLIKRSCHIWDEWMIPVRHFDGPEEFDRRPLVMVDVSQYQEKYSTPNIPGLQEPLSADPNEVLAVYFTHLSKVDSMKTEMVPWIEVIWKMLIDQSFHFYYPDRFTEHTFLSEGRVRGMVPEWYDPEVFQKFVLDHISNAAQIDLIFRNGLIYQAPSYKNKDVMVLDRYTPYRLTGVYYNASIVGPETADILHYDEINLYINQEQFGLLKIRFKKKEYGEVTPMYSFLDDDNLHRRIDPFIEVDTIETVAARELKKRLRYAKSHGKLGPVYGKQWRHWDGVNGGRIDQIQQCIELLKNDPFNRRILVNSWNVTELKEMKLPPCHMFFQFFMEPVDEETALKEYKRLLHPFDGEYSLDNIPKYRISMLLYMRSNDVFLGAPFNIAQYATLLIKMGAVVNALPGTLTYVTGDTHLYSNHVEQVEEQLSREPYDLPIYSVSNWGAKDPRDVMVHILNYKSHPRIDAPVAV